MLKARVNIWGPLMLLRTTESAIVHIVDDDAEMRGALESLFDSVGLCTQS